jgi:protein involved in polysaccharide export with SLBB domain
MRQLRSILKATLLSVWLPAAALAQFVQPVASALPERQYEQRAQLERAAQAAESQHRTQEAWMIRTRLQKGDFQEGDRILLALQNQSVPADTFIVRAGKVLQLPGMDDLSLEGVLRSELTPRLSAHLAKYLKDPAVRATPLVRIGVIGHVRQQGFYYTPTDVVLSDLLMRAGGLSPEADLGKIEIRRGADVIWTPADVQAALSDGLSLDRLNLRANDQLDVGEQKRFSWQAIVPSVTASLAVLVTIIQLTRKK